MRFGMFIDLQLPRPWSPGAEGRLLREAIAQVVLGEEVGIDFVWAQEHHFLEEYSHSSAPEVFLAACSQVTRTIRLGHGISLTPPRYNHPARVAERISTLDLLSGGRVEWGTGESSSRIELDGFGIDYVAKHPMWAEATREIALMMATDPYPGFVGEHFVMPPRNVVPKPEQYPHPPMWVACSNRETIRMAARLGLGALTFAFMDAREARFWVEEYYEEFRRGCNPIGRSVNPNVAMLSGYMAHQDGSVARQRGLDGLRFFAYGLSHYFRTGTHTPGSTDLWESFAALPEVPMAGVGGIGSPAEIIDHFKTLEEAGVDQTILLQQCGRYDNGHIRESLELFGEEIGPQFRERHHERIANKQLELAPYIEAAEARIQELRPVDVDPVAAFPAVLAAKGADEHQFSPRRSLESAAMWRMHVAGNTQVDSLAESD